MTSYLDQLAVRLRERGIAPDRVRATVGDLATHLQETGADPEQEFGPVEEFAGQLAGPGDAPRPPGAGEEPWRWFADTHVDEQLLNQFGDQGWEVERLDALGRFVSRRDPEQPQRWEYRREMIAIGEGRELEARLAPDGWEPCGGWAPYVYFKRPKAASIGPVAAISSPPDAPTRRNFLSRRFYLLAGLGVAAAVMAAAGRSISSGDVADGVGFVTGLIVGMLVPLTVFGALAAWRNRSR